MNEMTTTKRQRRWFSAEERARWVELFERSGKSVREFCRENAVDAVGSPSLSRWLRQRHAGAGRKRKEGSLVEVRVAPVPATAAVDESQPAWWRDDGSDERRGCRVAGGCATRALRGAGLSDVRADTRDACISANRRNGSALVV